MDLRILVKPLRASWLNLCVQVLFSDTVYAVDLKLHTLMRGHKMTLCAKYHNSELIFDRIMPLFGLKEFWLNMCVQVG